LLGHGFDDVQSGRFVLTFQYTLLASFIADRDIKNIGITRLYGIMSKKYLNVFDQQNDNLTCHSEYRPVF
jgi:hypothetical protein